MSAQSKPRRENVVLSSSASPAGAFREKFRERCLHKAQQLLESAPEAALKWLEQVPLTQRPHGVEAAIHYQIAKQVVARGDVARGDVARGDRPQYEAHLTTAVQKEPARLYPLYQRRLDLARRRLPLLEQRHWQVLIRGVDPAKRLPNSFLCPHVSGIWACGAYHSCGADRAKPWSRLVRLAKEPPNDERRQPIVSLATGIFCRYLVERTPLLSKVDVVVAVPANPFRYRRRQMSLPDELARAVEQQLGVPFERNALLVSEAAHDLELKRLNWPERAEAIRGALAAGPLGLGAGRTVLVVDDVVTSGATLREAARLLRAAGAADVYAMTLSHTED